MVPRDLARGERTLGRTALRRSRVAAAVAPARPTWRRCASRRSTAVTDAPSHALLRPRLVGRRRGGARLRRAADATSISNARNHRMDPLVPLLIPEVNPDHLALLDRQRRARGWTGSLVTNPNCATIVVAMVLGALRQFQPKRIMVTTMQALSGAGYPGVASLDATRQRHPLHRRRRGREDRDRNAQAARSLSRTARSSTRITWSARRSTACRCRTGTPR